MLGSLTHSHSLSPRISVILTSLTTPIGVRRETATLRHHQSAGVDRRPWISRRRSIPSVAHGWLRRCGLPLDCESTGWLRRALEGPYLLASVLWPQTWPQPYWWVGLTSIVRFGGVS